MPSITLNSGLIYQVLHRSFGKAFSVRIDLIDGSPPGTFPGVFVEMHGIRHGVAPTLDTTGNFLALTRFQCIPVGSIRARVKGLDSARVEYTVSGG